MVSHVCCLLGFVLAESLTLLALVAWRAAIAAFLTLLAHDIEAGRNIRGLPEDLARTMLEHAGHKVVLGDDFDEDVEI